MTNLRIHSFMNLHFIVIHVLQLRLSIATVNVSYNNQTMLSSLKKRLHIIIHIQYVCIIIYLARCISAKSKVGGWVYIQYVQYIHVPETCSFRSIVSMSTVGVGGMNKYSTMVFFETSISS